MQDVTGVEDLLRQSGYQDFCWLAGVPMGTLQMPLRVSQLRTVGDLSAGGAYSGRVPGVFR